MKDMNDTYIVVIQTIQNRDSLNELRCRWDSVYFTQLLDVRNIGGYPGVRFDDSWIAAPKNQRLGRAGRTLSALQCMYFTANHSRFMRAILDLTTRYGVKGNVSLWNIYAEGSNMDSSYKHPTYVQPHTKKDQFLLDLRNVDIIQEALNLYLERIQY